jgi:preprotein translocase subunit SecE
VTETQGSTAATPERGRSERPQRKKKSLLARLALFYRQVIAELRKVIWPTRQELITYTSVVVTFVAIIMTIVFVLDYGFSKAVVAVFGR